MSVFTLNLASLLGLGIAIDYALVMVSRFREEIASLPIEEAVARTMATAGRAILFSAATSALGLSGLMLFELMMLRSLGLGGIVVILVSMLVALTLLPAVMAVAGKRINSLSIIPMRKSQTRPWHRLAGWVMRYPLVVSVPLIIFLVFLGTPTLGIKIGAPWTSHLPPTAHTREGWDVAAQELGKGELSPMLVVVRSPDKLLTSQNIGALYDLAHEIEADGRVQRVESVVTFDPRMTKAQYQLALSNPTLLPLDIQARLKKAASEHSTVLQVFSKYDPASDESRALMRNIRTIEHAGDFGIYVGGSTAGLADYIDVMYGDFPWVVLYVLGTIYIALLLLFRSLVIPLKAVIMNAMSIFASYGALVFIFQQGHFQELLGFQATGYLEPTIPIILFCIVFGLSMDYELFLLTRVKEIYDSSHDNTHSVGEGLERTGSIITSAALILVLVAASFASGQVVLIKALGIGVAIAVFLDATVVRALLVPALMRIMGDWNWWAPRWLLRLLPQWHVPS
jgi:RND superfamily putative drug exporter